MPQSRAEADLPTRRAAVMFFLSFLFLAVAAVPVHAVPEAGLEHMGTALYALAALWVVLLAEALEGLRHCEHPTRALARLLIIALLPPFRMTLATMPTGGRVWLPLLGWQRADRELAEHLERVFSVPMLCIAAMILPILAVEFFGAARVSASPHLALTLQVGTAMIWLAFALEFILMVSVTEDKWAYCWRHWVDIAIIVLPLVAFLRGLRLLRAARMTGLSKLLKVYRLRGLALRAYRGLVVLDVLDRILHHDPERRLRYLRALLKEQEYQMERLRAKIQTAEQELAEREERAGASARDQWCGD
jgi:hypothetical protein